MSFIRPLVVTLACVALALVAASVPAADEARPGGDGAGGDGAGADRPRERIRAGGQELIVTTRPAAARPATRPAATRPATRPAREEAKVSPEVQAVLDRVGAAYGKLQGLNLAGRLTLKVDGQHTKGNHEATFASSYQAPFRFRHEGKDQVLLGSTGAKIYGYTGYANAFLQDEAPEGKPMLGELPDDMRKILVGQNLSLALALSKDPARDLKLLASELELVKSPPAGTVALALKLADGEYPAVAVFDSQTHLLKRVTVDRRSDFVKMKRDDVKVAEFAIEYTSVEPNPQARPEAFAWKPPQGARDMARRGAADDDDELMGGGGSGGVIAVGTSAPDFELPDLNGKRVKLSSHKGQVVLLDFWATWCGPCVAAMPKLNALYKDLKGDGLVVYAVNQGEDAETAGAFMERKKFELPVLLDEDGKVGSKLYGVTGIPTQVLIGKDGVVRKVIVGFNPDGEAEVRAAVEAELKK